jgi:hypothetical protein
MNPVLDGGARPPVSARLFSVPPALLAASAPARCEDRRGVRFEPGDGSLLVAEAEKGDIKYY